MTTLLIPLSVETARMGLIVVLTAVPGTIRFLKTGSFYRAVKMLL